MNISQALGALSGLSLAVLVGLYLYSFYKFHALVQQERPDFVERKGSLSFFYNGLPRAFDPNVTIAVLRTVLSSRLRDLRSPEALRYGHRVRFLLFAIAAVFILLIFVGDISAA